MWQVAAEEWLLYIQIGSNKSIVWSNEMGTFFLAL